MKKKVLSILMICIICLCGILVSACGETPESFDINVLVWGANLGTVSDNSGTYTEGTNVTITATPKPTSISSETTEFVCWIHDSVVVSNKAEYSFKIDSKTSGTYIAIFTCNDLEFITLDSFNHELAYTQSTTASLTVKSVNLSIGDSYNTLVDVCSVDKDFESTFPMSKFDNVFVFDKTKALYAKFVVVYTLNEGTDFTSTTYKEISVTSGQSVTIDLENPIEYRLLNPTGLNFSENEGSTVALEFSLLSDLNFSLVYPEDSVSE